MLVFRNVRLEKLEVEHFQKHFWASPSAALLERVFQVVSEHWTKTVTSLGASDMAVRQAQGALDALGSVMELCQGIAQVSMEEMEQEGEEEIEKKEEQDDVGY